MKTCPACRMQKADSDFYLINSTRDGVRKSTYCKPCTAARNRAWERQHPEQVRQAHAANMRLHAEANRLRVARHRARQRQRNEP